MAERRKPRKRIGKPAPESKRLSLLDLPPVMDPSGDLPTNPGRVIRPAYATTLLPAPAEPLADTSLASLALATRRATTVPREPRVTNRRLDAAPADAAPAPPVTEPSPPPDFGSPSTLPPPVQMPSEPPRGRAPNAVNPWLRTLGVIVLSASVGAIVSSAMSGVRNGLDVSKAESARAAGSTDIPICAPAPAAPDGASRAAPTAEPAPEAPRIAVDTLPLQPGGRRAVAVETISLEPARPDRDSSRVAEAPPTSHRGLRGADISARAKSEPASSRPTSPTEPLPKAPSRAAVRQAVGRSASAAMACDSGPQDGKVMLTFAPSGAVQSVSLVKGFGDAAVNGCVLRAFGRARVPAFSGDPVQVRKSIAW